MADYSATRLSVSVQLTGQVETRGAQLVAAPVVSVSAVRSAERPALTLPLGVPSILFGERNTGTPASSTTVIIGGFNQGYN